MYGESCPHGIDIMCICGKCDFDFAKFINDAEDYSKLFTL